MLTPKSAWVAAFAKASARKYSKWARTMSPRSYKTPFPSRLKPLPARPLSLVRRKLSAWRSSRLVPRDGKKGPLRPADGPAPIDLRHGAYQNGASRRQRIGFQGVRQEPGVRGPAPRERRTARCQARVSMHVFWDLAKHSGTCDLTAGHRRHCWSPRSCIPETADSCLLRKRHRDL